MTTLGATGDGIIVITLLIVAVTTLVLIASSQPHDGDNLEVTQLYVYPVKALRGSPVTEARIGKYGVVGDRTFSLQKVHRDNDNDEPKYETMLTGYYLQLLLFRASIEYNEDQGPDAAEVVVTWNGRGTEFDKAKDVKTTDEIRFPLHPSTQGRRKFNTSLHTSNAMAFEMDDQLSTWFSDRLGFEVLLVYIGDGCRPVLGSMAPNSKAGLTRGRLTRRVRSLIPGLAHPPESLVFNDIGHYHVVTEESNDQVSSRLDQGYTMDVTKFRPNIVVRGAPGAFVEDYWGELTFDGDIQMPLTSNCYRCQSITADYDTGKTATDDRGMVWKKLNKDRRVDKGAKYSPVFGRYGYCFGSSEGKKIYIGQKAKVTYINKDRTTFGMLLRLKILAKSNGWIDWPHLTTFGLTQTKK
ncbi:mosc domain-containing [Fusarium albosuccineum]|uniref:Mosc domain-containing n=1 Tax=Fusarium albosuccineum TaxID=1237068 RepID=A0A8H4LBV2_9HYPO|nr:mosc domain-containing [Fusarium albosuccineum]